MSERNIDSDSSRRENERQYELIDQLLSMHSLLRDMYERRAFWLNTIQICISFFLCVFAFVGDDVLRALKYELGMTRFVLGFAAVAMLILSITEFRVDWRAISSKHIDAVKRLSFLKAKYRMAFDETGGNVRRKNLRLTTEYDKTMSIMPPIPERYFLRLKSSHQYKKMLSQRLSLNPKAPQWFLSVQLRLEGIRTALKKRK